MQIKGIGVDLIEVARIAKAIDRERFRRRIYTPLERKYLKNRNACSWAARFAAKEAVMKALGRGWGQGAAFLEIEIGANKWGRPQVHLLGQTEILAEQAGFGELLLSLSHTKELAIAYVIALGKE